MLSTASLEALAPFFARLQKDCLPGLWSKGVALSRDALVQLDSSNAEEIILRVLLKDKPVSPKVTFWPEDEDHFCDCGDRNEICAHVAACIIALRSGKALPSASSNSASRPAISSAPSIAYRLKRLQGLLSLERFVCFRDRELPLHETLVSFIGGIASGRISELSVRATKEDFGLDLLIAAGKKGPIERPLMPRILQAMAPLSNVTLDGLPVQISGKPTGIKATLVDFQNGFKLSGQMDPSITEVFSNGAALCGNLLRPLEAPSLSGIESSAVSQEGHLFRTNEEIAFLVTELLPGLQKKLSISVQTQNLPEVQPGRPRGILRIDSIDGDSILVVPSIEYESKNGNHIFTPDRAAEHALARKFQNELHLSPGQPTRLSGMKALEFVSRSRGLSEDWQISGTGLRDFAVHGSLTPHVRIHESGLEARFEIPASGKGLGHTASVEKVFEAWNEGNSFVSLLGGGFAQLPTDWLNQYGARISALLSAKTGSTPPKTSVMEQLELVELGDELGEILPKKLKQLQSQLLAHEGIPDAALPTDLKAELRHYQRQGINWLCLLRDSKMGALLADDMGLGKTLQALCAIRGRTLVVCPTSVLSSWSEQISQFRPALKLATYYGAQRKLDVAADVTLTSYALLRLDRDELVKQDWETIVLDEAQSIKNPESQAARAAHALNAAYRIALSGTPVQNRLEDLWSQFQFVNPGMLGTLQSFQEQYAAPIARGDARAAQRLRSKIRPFLLRRLKKEVAPELPPRTETTLHCELSVSETDLYKSILAASRREVLEKLETQGNIMAALEMLLRLRQACCHPALVPGTSSETRRESSSKLDVLLETLSESIGLGHRALVFSQWTSLLDLVEPLLTREGFGYLRLDGSTRDREAVVRAFQDPAGPPVLLISLKAGGVGLTLTAADHIFILDPWWNPAVEDQAADRAHRIGQKNPVLIHRLVAKDTVEDKILALQKRKLEIAGAALSDSSGALSLTRNDILDLLN